MTLNPRNVAVGIANGSTVYADVTTLGSDVAVRVTLTADYTMLQPDGAFFVGFPFRPQFTGAATPQHPHVVSNGTTLTVLACEATAIVNAGAGVLS